MLSVFHSKLFGISIHAPTRGATLPGSISHQAPHDFNPRSHEGSDVSVPVYDFIQRVFQSTLPRGERQSSVCSLVASSQFQSTLPRGERRGCCKSSREAQNFNPRSHEGSDRRRLRSLLRPVEFQSTLPRGERLKVIYSHSFICTISIHAPTRGATGYMLRQLRDPEYFNPRSHEGSDGIFADLYAKKVISIHAPTRGATRYCFCIKLVIGFQSTLPRGERQ